MASLRLVGLAFFALLPSALKIATLKLLGARIGRNCRIGLSIVDAKDLEIGDHVLIGNFNLIYNLKKATLGSGAKINSFNWITGARTGEFRLGRNSSIRRFHFVDASGSFHVGDNTIIAGRSSLFFTHGLTPTNLDDIRSIEIGDWCYVGAACRFLPGSGVGEGTFVGMGSVVTKRYTSTYVLLAGNPALVRKEIPKDSEYFERPFLRHENHPSAYDGSA